MNESLFPTRDARPRPWSRTRPWTGVLADDPAAITTAVTRGVSRWLEDSGFATLREFKLGTGRRADVAGISAQGLIAMVEVKSTPADYHADDKWLEYVPYCDAFSFAVPPDFPWKILPSTCGVVLADAYAATVIRPAPLHRLHAARRRALTLRFAIAAGQRLSAMVDPRE
ncbi:MAG: MmcB family DNA repair protein [Alphaproteobacteria bacterium]|nr:MmcB family DNA repair protein [Alphaproteobacteria bacterium]